MTFLAPYKKDPARIRDLGEFALWQLEAAAEQTDVAACPFCGGEAKLGLMNTYGTPALFIQCTCCHVKTEVLPAGTGAMKYDAAAGTWAPTEITLIDRLKQAAAIWNRRPA